MKDYLHKKLKRDSEKNYEKQLKLFTKLLVIFTIVSSSFGAIFKFPLPEAMILIFCSAFFAIVLLIFKL